MHVGKHLSSGPRSDMGISLGSVGVKCIFSVTDVSSSMGFRKSTAKATCTDNIFGGPIVGAHLFVGGFSLGRKHLNSLGVCNR